MSDLADDLIHDEGLRLFVYDDATGKPIKPGSVVVGHPSIGVGRALDTQGLSVGEARMLLVNDIDTLTAAVPKKLPFWGQLNEVRRRVLLNMAFNLGVNGLLSFRGMLDCVAKADWPGAVAALKSSRWHSQVGARAVRLENRMLTGVSNGSDLST